MPVKYSKAIKKSLLDFAQRILMAASGTPERLYLRNTSTRNGTVISPMVLTLSPSKTLLLSRGLPKFFKLGVSMAISAASMFVTSLIIDVTHCAMRSEFLNIAFM